MTTEKVKVFNYTDWPVFSYGNPNKPIDDGSQWSAYISAGGQNDAVVVYASNKERVIALRKHILESEKVNFLLKSIDKIESENSVRGDSDKTSELIAKIKLDFEKKFKY
jgi:hypothetical protein